MIKTIVKALANAFDAIALIGLDSQVEKRSKKAAADVGWDPDEYWDGFVEYNNSHQEQLNMGCASPDAHQPLTCNIFSLTVCLLTTCWCVSWGVRPRKEWK